MEYYILYNGGKIYYTDSGRGEAIILIHGYLESSDIWQSFAGKLTSRYRVISVDLPGHGRSTIYGESHSMELMASAVNELMASLDIKKAFITGHSLGGYVILALLEMFPDRLSGYCLFHSHPLDDTLEARTKREREILLVRAGKKFLMYPNNISNMFAEENLTKFANELKHLKDNAARIPDAGIIAVLNGMMSRPSRVKLMEEGKVPCLWILGKKDKYISSDTVLSRVMLPPNAQVVLLENSGHLGFIEEEDKSLEILSNFVRGLEN